MSHHFDGPPNLLRFDQVVAECPKCGMASYRFNLELHDYYYDTISSRSVRCDFMERRCPACSWRMFTWCKDHFSPETVAPFELEIVDNIHEVLAQMDVDEIVPDKFPVPTKPTFRLFRRKK